MTREHGREQAARIVLEAALKSGEPDGDKATCAKYGITIRTLQRYRKMVATGSNPELSQTIADKKAKVEEGWADEIPGALRAAVAFLRKAAESADATDPEAIHAVAGAMKLLSETSATWKVLDVRLARAAQPRHQPAQPATGAPPAGNVVKLKTG